VFRSCEEKALLFLILVNSKFNALIVFAGVVPFIFCTPRNENHLLEIHYFLSNAPIAVASKGAKTAVRKILSLFAGVASSFNLRCALIVLPPIFSSPSLAAGRRLGVYYYSKPRMRSQKSACSA
jgi:hypothetical protein